METKELPIKEGTIKVVLNSDSQILDEVVVTGMTKVDKRLFTGATDRLKAEDARLDGIPDVSRALEGRSAGVSVQNVSGTFGTAPKIRVRGATSICGSSKPLWVVDGVVMEDAVEINADDLSSGDAVTLISSAIAGLSADDIESFQILKDGSATSIYGAIKVTASCASSSLAVSVLPPPWLSAHRRPVRMGFAPSFHKITLLLYHCNKSVSSCF